MALCPRRKNSEITAVTTSNLIKEETVHSPFEKDW
jgi:hypothetical protein